MTSKKISADPSSNVINSTSALQIGAATTSSMVKSLIRRLPHQLAAKVTSPPKAGPRRYLVTEFDTGTPDEQAALILHLSGYAPLVMMLRSGGKSLHAWWSCAGAAKYSGLSPALIYELIKDECIISSTVLRPGRRRGRRLVQRESLDAYIEAGIGRSSIDNTRTARKS